MSGGGEIDRKEKSKLKKMKAFDSDDDGEGIANKFTKIFMILSCFYSLFQQEKNNCRRLQIANVKKLKKKRMEERLAKGLRWLM
jgi:5S rRNA maturation endonuclease (ribonuclease M5)